MEVIDKTTSINFSAFETGDVFKLMNRDSHQVQDILMICEGLGTKYYFASLYDGALYGWGNGEPANSIEELFNQISNEEYYLKPVDATLTIENIEK